MKIKFNTTLKTIALAGAFPFYCHAQNPIIQTCFTADPAPMVYNGTVYLYADHDEGEGANYYTMHDWRVYSSKDMVNWTDHGRALHFSDFTWSDGEAWAAQCVERNGKFYWYICCRNKERGHHSIGVAVSDSPTGPFKDAIGKPLISQGWQDIDPSVFIDDDGQAYLYWGNSKLWYVKLNEDMVSYSGGIVEVDVKDKSAFGSIFIEGPWLSKHNNTYYLSYAAGGIPEHIAYSMSSSPIGPWKYGGVIMPTQGKSFTNHSGVIDYKGKSYFFYHNGALQGGGGFTRSICIEPFKYNEDGTIPQLNMTNEGVTTPSGNLNPFERVEAETIAWSEGIKTDQRSAVGVYVTSIHNNDYQKIRAVDFGKRGANKFTVALSKVQQGSKIELRIDSPEGEVIGTLSPETTNSEAWHTFTCKIKQTKGVHDLYIKFIGQQNELFDFDWWKMK